MTHTERDVAAAIGDVVRRLPKTAWCSDYADGPGLCIGLDNGQHFDIAVVERISERVHPRIDQAVAS